MNPHDYPRVDRRTAIKWMLTAAASMSLAERAGTAPAPSTSSASPSSAMASPPSPITAAPAAEGYGRDADLTRVYKPGDVWPLTFTDEQRRTVAVLCDAIIPADERSPSAASVGVPDFIDEWISAPYPWQKRDRQPILDGIAWLDTEAQLRFGRNFVDLERQQLTSILDDICHPPEAPPELAHRASFFSRFRDLTAGGFYTTPEGMKDLRYIGNVPLAEFTGPPPEVLAKLGLA